MRRLICPPNRPQTNWKIERWFQTVLRECLFLHPLASEDDRQRAKGSLVEYQNNDRPHLCIDGLNRISRLASPSITMCKTTPSAPEAEAGPARYR